MKKLLMGLVIVGLSAAFSVACTMEKKEDVGMGEAAQEEAAAPAEQVAPAQQAQPSQGTAVEEVEEVEVEGTE